jgi:hypothetical protein
MRCGSDFASAIATDRNEPEIAASGAQNLLDQPEFHDLRKLRAILRIVEEQRTLYDLIADELNPTPARRRRSRTSASATSSAPTSSRVQRRHRAVSLRRSRRRRAGDPRAAPHAVRPPDRARVRHGAFTGRPSQRRRDPVTVPTDYYEVLGVARDADERRSNARIASWRASTIPTSRRQGRGRAPLQGNQRSVRGPLGRAEAGELRSLRSRGRQRRRRRRVRAVRRRGLRRHLRHVLRRRARRRRAAAPQRPARGSDLRYDVEITLEEAFTGTSARSRFRHLASCPTCKGSGAEPGTLVVPCDRCGGSGIQRQVRQTPLGQFVTQTTCSEVRRRRPDRADAVHVLPRPRTDRTGEEAPP